MQNFNHHFLNNDEKHRETDWLTVEDLRSIFGIGDTKARKMMAVLPSVRIGKRQYVLLSDLNKYIKDNNGIIIHWD